MAGKSWKVAFFAADSQRAGILVFEIPFFEIESFDSSAGEALQGWRWRDAEIPATKIEAAMGSAEESLVEAEPVG